MKYWTIYEIFHRHSFAEQKQIEIKKICRGLVEEIANKVDSFSVVDTIISSVVEVAWKNYKVEAAWKLLGEDDGTLGDILTRIRELEETKVCILERDRMERTTTVGELP